MVALDYVLMAIVVVILVAALSWAIVSDRRSKRAAASSDASLQDNLMMPRQLRTRRMVRPTRRGRSSATPRA